MYMYQKQRVWQRKTCMLRVYIDKEYWYCEDWWYECLLASQSSSKHLFVCLCVSIVQCQCWPLYTLVSIKGWNMVVVLTFSIQVYLHYDKIATCICHECVLYIHVHVCSMYTSFEELRNNKCCTDKYTPVCIKGSYHHAQNIITVHVW